MKKIALISVSDKTGIDSIASELSKMGYDIISTVVQLNTSSVKVLKLYLYQSSQNLRKFLKEE